MKSGHGALRGYALLLLLAMAGCDEGAPDELSDLMVAELVVTTQRGIPHGVCDSDSDCVGGAICPVGYGYCVKPCRADADCAAPTHCLLDRLEVNFCGCESGSCAR